MVSAIFADQIIPKLINIMVSQLFGYLKSLTKAQKCSKRYVYNGFSARNFKQITERYVHNGFGNFPATQIHNFGQQKHTKRYIYNGFMTFNQKYIFQPKLQKVKKQ